MKWGSESKQTYILRTLFLFTSPFYSVILKLAKIILVSISFHTFWNIGVALKCQTQKLFVSQSLLFLFIFVFLFWRNVKCPFISLHKFWFCWVSQKSVSIRQLILNFSSNKMDLRPRWENFSEELLCLRYHFLFLYQIYLFQESYSLYCICLVGMKKGRQLNNECEKAFSSGSFKSPLVAP